MINTEVKLSSLFPRVHGIRGKWGVITDSHEILLEMMGYKTVCDDECIILWIHQKALKSMLNAFTLFMINMNYSSRKLLY